MAIAIKELTREKSASKDRTKPDVVAPGVAILSAATRDPGFPGSYPLSDTDASTAKTSLFPKLVRLFKTVHGRQTREVVFAGAGGRVLISETSSTDALPDDLKRDVSSSANGNLDLARFHVPIDAY